MIRWPLIVALLADPPRESRRLAGLLARMPAERRRHRIADDRGDAGRPLPAGQREILAAIEDEPMKPAELARRLGRTPGAMRFAVGLMAKAGHVERLQDGTYRPSPSREGDE